MTEDRLPLAELLAKAGDGGFLRNVAETMLQMLMEADAEGLIGSILLEANNEWQMQHRYMGVEAMGETLNLLPTDETPATSHPSPPEPLPPHAQKQIPPRPRMLP